MSCVVCGARVGEPCDMGIDCFEGEKTYIEHNTHWIRVEDFCEAENALRNKWARAEAITREAMTSFYCYDMKIMSCLDADEGEG